MSKRHSNKPDPARSAQDAPPPETSQGAAQPGEAGAMPETPPSAEAEPIPELELLRAELADAQDLALRCQAELENYRKRIHRQMDDERRYAALPLLRDLLPVLDNMRRAIEAAENTHDTASLLEGIKMVLGQFQTALAKHDCVEIPALYEPFDPHFHEAISQQPSGEYPPSTVILVSQAGYRLHDRVVRPSQVIVSSAPPSERSDS